MLRKLLQFIVLVILPFLNNYSQCNLSITSVTVSDATCFGNCDGVISVAAAGSFGAITYTWTDVNGNNLNNNNDSLVNVCAGDYSIQLMDGSNCIVDTTVTVVSSSAITASVNRTNTTCTGNTGQLDVTGAGGCGGPYQYSVNGGAFQSSGTFSNLSVGFYSIVTQDACGCTDTILDYITATDGPLVASLNYVEPLCNGSDNGSITVFAFGTNPIQYSIDGGTSLTSNNAFTNLAPGTYPVVILDGGGCQSLGIVEMSEPDLIVPSVSAINETCVLNDGEVIFSHTGGVSPFQYSIDNGTTYQSSNTFSGLNGGTYNYIIMDNNGCTASGSVTLSTGQGPTISDSIIIQPSCSSVCNGAIQLNVIGNNLPFSYTINGSANSDTSFQNLCVGTQTIVVSDANNCQTTFITTLNSTSAPSAQFSMSDSIGIAPLSVNFTNTSSNSTSYIWLFGDSTMSDTAVNATYTYADSGIYTVTLIAFNSGCVDSTFATVIVTGEPGVTMPNVFTPNGDGINDQFRPIAIGVQEMTMTIYNRWGEIVSQVWGTKTYWDGRTFPAGQICPDGTYFYVLKAVDINGNAIDKAGSVQLFR